MGNGRFGVGTATSSGIAKSAMAMKYPMPRKSEPAAIIVAGLIVTLVWCYVATYWAIIPLAITALFVAISCRHNSANFAIQSEKWGSSFLCLRCEELFIPGYPQIDPAIPASSVDGRQVDQSFIGVLAAAIAVFSLVWLNNGSSKGARYAVASESTDTNTATPASDPVSAMTTEPTATPVDRQDSGSPVEVGSQNIASAAQSAPEQAALPAPVVAAPAADTAATPVVADPATPAIAVVQCPFSVLDALAGVADIKVTPSLGWIPDRLHLWFGDRPNREVTREVVLTGARILRGYSTSDADKRQAAIRYYGLEHIMPVSDWLAAAAATDDQVTAAFSGDCS